ncbi:MAG: SPOR domain-containing protein [Rickettsiales bacterium]|jgi:cell division septation protein DedD|nr:SPOR domain-containing protein [Rickettsiales bacterium]
MAENEELELLDLDDEAELPELPSGNPLESAARPRRPWLLFGIAALVVALSAYIIIRVVARGGEESIDINIDVQPALVNADAESGNDSIVPGNVDDAPTVPVRIVEDRANVTFNPNAPVVEAPRPRPSQKPSADSKPAPSANVAIKKPAASAVTSGWVVQFGSYNTRNAALAGQKRLQAGHPSLFAGRPFVVLAAVLPDGRTVYRLRITGFASGGEANGFCGNAKSDGLDCFVAK